MSSPSVPVRRSTRRAARSATTRIAEELAPQRSSSRLASLSHNGNGNGEGAASGGPTAVVATAAGVAGDSSPPTPERRDVPRPAAGGTKETPIVLDDDSIDEMDLKPAAAGVVVAGTAATRPPADFICAICLDAPPCMSEVASISGCTHRFCFDCIDRWAVTENKCPCCKARFQTIDRVVALPPSPAEESETEAAAGGGGGRRSKRKRERRDLSPNTRGARRSGGVGGGTAPPDRRVNSRVVEDRNQQSVSAIMVDAAMVQQILSSLISREGGSLLGRGGQITFGTSEEGRPQIRMIHPGNGSMVGIMEMYLSDAAPPGGAASSGGAGSNPSGARVRSTRAHRRALDRSSGSEHGARVTVAAAPAAGLSSPLETRSAERRSTINFATGSATGSSVAASGNSHPTNAATQQARSAFQQFFSSLRDMRDSAGRSVGSPPGASADARAAMGVAVGASDVRGASSPSNRMTIRFVTRPTAPTRGTLPGVDRDGHSRLTNPPSRSSGGRSASGGSGDEDSSRGGSDEPIVID